MKAAFLVHRQNYYKFMGPLIQAALTRGWQCQVWLFRGEESKNYLALDQDAVPALLAGQVKTDQFASNDQVAALARQHEPDLIFSLHPRSKYADIPVEVGFINLHHGVDTFANVTPDDLQSSDIFCLQTNFWLDWGARYFKALGFGDEQDIRAALAEKAIFEGTPRLDVAMQLNTQTIREKLGIPRDKRVVLYFPLNVAYWPGHWPALFASRGVERIKSFGRGLRDEGLGFLRYLPWLLFGWNEDRLTSAVREFCDRNNAFLIAKARRKDPLRAASDLADMAVYDEQYFPATVYELMAVADICIHSYSSAAFEMTAFDVFGICVDRPNLDQPIHQLWRTAEAGGLFNYPGANLWMRLPEMIQSFGRLSISGLQTEIKAIRAYKTQYVDPGTGSSSERILNYAAHWVAEKKVRHMAGQAVS